MTNCKKLIEEFKSITCNDNLFEKMTNVGELQTKLTDLLKKHQQITEPSLIISNTEQIINILFDIVESEQNIVDYLLQNRSDLSKIFLKLLKEETSYKFEENKKNAFTN
jgi:hypothetical protein